VFSSLVYSVRALPKEHLAASPVEESGGTILALLPLIEIRNLGSRIIGRRYKKTDWEPPVPDSLPELAEFCREKMKYKGDPVRGLLDHIQPVQHMNWQLENSGKIEGDCDDMATYVAYMLKRMGYEYVYRVNIARYKHVICVFKDGSEYKYFTNQYLRRDTFNSMYEAVSHWCNGKDYKPTKMYYSERL
jgi:hypothetical protein